MRKHDLIKLSQRSLKWERFNGPVRHSERIVLIGYERMKKEN